MTEFVGIDDSCHPTSRGSCVRQIVAAAAEVQRLAHGLERPEPRIDAVEPRLQGLP